MSHNRDIAPFTDLSLNRPRVGVVSPYWSFWEHSVGHEFRVNRLHLAQRATQALAGQIDVLAIADPANAAEARHVARKWAPLRPDAILVLQTMAVPSASTLELLDALESVPVVIWALHEAGAQGLDVDHRIITMQGATVGTPMLLNVLTRRRRRVELIVGRVDDSAVVRRAGRAIATAAAVRRIRSARLGLVGRPQDGYLHVDVDHDALTRATGIRVIQIEPHEYTSAYHAASDTEVDALVETVRATWSIDPTVPSDALRDSMRASVALADLSRTHGLDGGAMNCHVPGIRYGEDIGITPCWALGAETSAGRPWTCTGDLLTAVAMLATKQLGGAALYHELETIDYETGEMVIANSGEHDLAWMSRGAVPRLAMNGWFCGSDPRCGVCAVLHPDPGPATLVGFTPHPEARGGFRFVVARGSLSDRSFPATGTSNGAFRFSSGPVVEAWRRWALAGVNHHAAATPGDLLEELQSLADQLGIEMVEV